MAEKNITKKSEELQKEESNSLAEPPYELVQNPYKKEKKKGKIRIKIPGLSKWNDTRKKKDEILLDEKNLGLKRKNSKGN